MAGRNPINGCIMQIALRLDQSLKWFFASCVEYLENKLQMFIHEILRDRLTNRRKVVRVLALQGKTL